MILVTGAKGFIGKHLCRSLSNVIEVDTNNIDIRHRETLIKLFNQHDIEVVIHLAAMSHVPDAIKDPMSTFEVNVTGTMNLLECARLFDVKKFIYVSSASTYGNFKHATEDSPLYATNIYGTTKACGDLLTQTYYKQYNVPTTVIRTSSVYGLGDTHPRLINNFINNAFNGKSLVIEGGEQTRDFTYVKDLIQAIVNVVNHYTGIGEVFNISGGKAYSIKQVAEIIQSCIPCIIEYKPARKVDLNRGALDITKAKLKLFYKPQYPLERGIKEMIDGSKIPQNRPTISGT